MIFILFQANQQNQIKMEALLGIPKILSNIEDIRSNKDIQTVFKEYKRNVQIFIDNMKNQVSKLIDGYEQKIASLKAQNSQLKSSISNLPSKEFIKTGTSAFSPSKTSAKQFSSMPQYNRGQLEKMQTAKSKIFTPVKGLDNQEDGLSPLLNRVQMQSDELGLDNPERQFYDKSVSKFEQKSKRKKQREQELRLFLESGKKSLNYTTQRFFDAVGKSNKNTSNNEEDQLQQRQSQQEKNNQNDSFLNKSLGNICNNLDNSFISKRARSQKRKKMEKIEQQSERKRKQQIMLNQMMKKRGVTNLLQRLRDNAEVTSKNQKQIITISKLISCGEKEDLITKKSTRNSKVMINPVPIDIEKKFKATRNNSLSISPSSPEKKPQSILKQSTILSKSITGISSIQFRI